MRISLLSLVLLLAGSAPAFAHRLHVEAKVIGDQLRIEAYYSDDTPAQEAKVTVRLGDQFIAEGRTDERGVWTCPRPTPGSYIIRAESAGHAAKETLVVPELDPVPTAGPPPTTDDRSQRTRTPWGRLALGLVVIGGLWAAWAISRRAFTRASGAA